MKEKLTKQAAMALLYNGLRIGQFHWDLSETFVNNLYTWYNTGNNYKIVELILDEWGCFDQEHNGQLSLIRLPSSVAVRPCARLSTLYMTNGTPDPHSMFKELELDPDMFRKMVYTYRMAYDILYSQQLLYLTYEEADKFTDQAALYQIDAELGTILG